MGGMAWLGVLTWLAMVARNGPPLVAVTVNDWTVVARPSVAVMYTRKVPTNVATGAMVRTLLESIVAVPAPGVPSRAWSFTISPSASVSASWTLSGPLPVVVVRSGRFDGMVPTAGTPPTSG